MSKLIKEILDALNAVNQNKTQPYDRQGEVKRIEGKIAWVKLEGSDRETPIQMTIACDVGDTVQARIGGGSAWLTGNLTAPPTDDKKANEAITMVTNVVQEVQEQVEEALEEATDVEDVTMQYCLSDSSSTFVQYGDWSNTPPEYVSGKYYWVRSVLVDDEGNETYGEPRYSQETQLSVETSRAYATTNAHFWYDSTGAYVTDSTQDDYKSSATNKYATRVTPTGILQSYSGNTLSSWTSSGISFYQGDSNNTPTASFGSGGVNLYGGGSLGASITSSRMTVYSGSTSVADFGSTVRIGASGSGHISVSSTKLEFYDSSTRLGYIKTESSVGHFEIEHNSGNAGIVLSNGAATVHGNTGLQLSSSNGKVSISGSVVELDPVVLAGTLYSSDYQESSSATPNTHYGASSIYSGYYKVGLIKGGSSKRYKHDIKPIELDELDPRRLYDVNVVQFVYNKDYLDNEKDDRYDRPVAGFVAEEMREIYPTAVDMENGRPETWNPRYIIPPMLALIQEQNKRITELEKRVL